ncbi:MAG TPA: hypothetical protein DCY26_16765 [Hyphomonas sp.]|nr:hypothetical protein [Hyphomonas sp.]
MNTRKLRTVAILLTAMAALVVFAAILVPNVAGDKRPFFQGVIVVIGLAGGVWGFLSSWWSQRR